MKTNLKLGFNLICFLLLSVSLYAQNVEVDVNLNIKHEVGGISDFGRDRHITLHSSLVESDWVDELDKMDYLLNDLDVYLGRDNGSATWKFQYSAEDEDNPNHHDPDSLTAFADWWKTEYERILTDHGTKSFENRTVGMIQGTNPHPTYPTLSYWYMCGSEWGRANGYDWLPQDIETSADWMAQYLDDFFVETFAEEGELLPEYWEVINEPDMKMNTGAFMITSWEDIWEYHNLVAQGIRQRLGDKAPKIGGMTWGLHDFFADDLHRSRTVGYSDAYYGNGPENDAAKAYARAQTESAYLNQTGPWTQWDVLWKGFMDNAGPNMDFYSVHVYDWPTYGAGGGATRAGGHTEAMLDMLEWYDVSQNGVANRKPIVLSEYGAVQGAWEYTPHDARYDWESLKPFSSMMMQFLERPDYIIKSMPFTPVKATWGDTDTNGDGTPEYRYQYTMMRDDDMDGNWEWSDYIKWFELWAEVDGTRIDTKSTDPDIQVDAYVDGDDVFLILNNLEPVAKNIDLNFFGASPGLQNVRTKHLYLSGIRDVMLDDTNATSAPASVNLAADGTMILKYTYASNISIDETSVEKKFYGEAVGPNERVDIAAGFNTFHVNNVTIPIDASKAEAMLRITVNLFDAADDEVGFLSIDELKFNGVVVEAPLDWRGGQQKRSRWFGTLEIPIPANLIQTNNTIDVDFHHAGEVCVVNLSTWDFTTAPGRSEVVTSPDPVAVTNVSVSPTTLSLTSAGATGALAATIEPANATNKNVTWSTSDQNIASVDGVGVVTAVANGAAVITATTEDGGFTATSNVTVSISQNVPVTGVSLAPTTLALQPGQSADLNENVQPSNASNKAVTWSTNNSNVATVNAAGLVTAVSDGTATITVTTQDGNHTATASVTVSTTPPPPGDIIIEAEQFAATGGTLDDSPYGGPGFGVNATASTINYVNNNDWAEYSINVGEAGEYQITYQISTPSNDAAIQFSLDGQVIATDNVTNNGQWDEYYALTAVNTIPNLTAGLHTVRITASGTNEWQWNLDKITLSKVEGPGDIDVTGVSVAPMSISIEVGETFDLNEAVSPQNATDPSVSWSSNNSGIASVNASGLVTGVDTGSTAVIVSTTDGGFTAACQVTVTAPTVIQPLVIQAEDFASTGGTYQGFQIYNVGSVTAINYNQTGDWAEYSVNISASADYNVEYFMGTTVNGAAVQLTVDGQNIRTDNVPNNGNWDVFESMVAGGTVNLTAGSHTIRLTGAGTHGWEWNMDRFVLSSGSAGARVTSGVSQATSQPIEQSVQAYPNPVSHTLNLSGLPHGSYTLRMYDLSGSAVLDERIDYAYKYQLSTKDLLDGLYLLRISGEGVNAKMKIRIKH
ncbi:Ig-like domain-containing protein [Reichenbachiella sp.]|uniref:Ig-like domain-containing protein n=1 Tax=Reichenbachiella sp. TaxID=2184521 RepID=UPI003BB11591